MTSITKTDTKLLIFDLDGTLIDSVPDLAVSLNFSLKNNQLPTHSHETVRKFVGNGSFVLCERACPDNSERLLIEKVHSDFLSHYEQNSCTLTTPYLGVRNYLPKLADRYQLAIATNKPARFLPNILKTFGWEKLFKITLGGDSLPSKKPDPTPLLHICTTLTLLPTQAMMIGDSKNDIIAGQAANMPTLALSYGYNYNEPIANSCPDKVFDRFDALAEFLLS